MNASSTTRVVGTGLKLLALHVASLVLAAQDSPPAGKMWLLEEPPLEHIRAAYGVELTPEWLAETRLSGLRFGGGTGSFVSASGLVLTNHHVVRGYLSQMEHGGKNLGVVGYVARSPEEELPIPGASVNQLIEVHDVTAEVFAGIDLSDSIETVSAKLAERRRAVLARAAKTWPKLNAELVSLYRGARVHLYLYRSYSDVRLVFAPELQLGYFGGDTDNFRYPRYALDFSLCRVYDGGKPLDTSANHFTFTSGTLAEDAVVFSLGNPGSTDRMLTVAELEYRRDALYPAQTGTTGVFLEALDAYAKGHDKDADRLRELAFGIANGNKATLGHLEGLRDETRMAGRRAFEAEQRKRLEADEELAATFGDAWEEIDLALEELVPAYQRWWHLMPWHGEGQWFRPLTRALSVVEDLHPDFVDEDRFPFTGNDATFPFEPEVFGAHLARGREVLGADDPAIAAVLHGKEPAEAVRTYLEESRIGQRDFVEELRAGGWEAIEASEDPAIAAARELYPLLVDSQDQKKLLESVVAHQGLRLGKAIDGLEGPIVPPEATFSQRLSAGRIRGYTQDGQTIPAWTRLGGLYERCAKFGDQGEFDLPDLWFERKDALDLATPMNFVCTVDSTGGSSGSPIFDAQRRIVGVLFDGNEQATENEFIYQDGAARAVVLASDAMLEALEAVYQAPAIVAELRGAASASDAR